MLHFNSKIPIFLTQIIQLVHTLERSAMINLSTPHWVQL